MAPPGHSPFAGGSNDAARKKAGEPGRGVAPTEASTSRRERIETLMKVLVDIAQDVDANTNARVAAASAALNRIEGMPVQKNINADAGNVANMTDEQIRERLAEFSGTAA